jgi:hypothetical protein
MVIASCRGDAAAVSTVAPRQFCRSWLPALEARHGMRKAASVDGWPL